MRKQVNIHKAAVFSIVINAVQIAAVLAIAALVLFTDIEQGSAIFVEFALCVAAVLAAWGAMVDISQALGAQRVNEQTQMLEEAYGQLENLNVTLRAQRHDFLNHMQVVGSLLEMQEYDEATRYIGRVYGDVLSVSSVLRTASPAVNALLQAKMAESERRGVLMRVQTESKWEGLPVQGWEMCRVLGNLIDNALDALKQTEAPCLTLTLSETRERFCFVLENNGPPVPEALRERIFSPGFTTKGAGRGMGLFIVHEILSENGGDIRLESEQDRTAFLGWVPRVQSGEA